MKKSNNNTPDNALTKDSPSRVLTLGIQHVFAMFGSTVLVPSLTGLDPALTLFCMGIGTWIFHIITKFKVPAFMGSSFAFIASICAVREIAGVTDATFPAYVGCGIIASGLLYVILAGLVKLFGTKRITGFFPPVVTGSMIVIIGMMLAPTAMNNIINAEGIPAWKSWLVAVVTVAVIITVMFAAKGFLKLIPILIGIIAGYLLSLALGIVNTEVVAEAKWFVLPQFSCNQFFNLDIDIVLKSILLIAPIAVVTFVEHVGDITANGAVTGHDYIEDPGLHRTLLGCGLASVFSGGMGGPAATTYSENTGVLAATKNYNPATLRVAATFAIIISFFGKISGILTTIPAPILGGVSIILFGMIASVGLRMLVENKVDFTKSRNLIIASVMLVLGLGVGSGINIAGIVVSGTAIAAVMGVILNKVLPKDEEKEEVKEEVKEEKNA